MGLTEVYDFSTGEFAWTARSVAPSPIADVYGFKSSLDVVFMDGDDHGNTPSTATRISELDTYIDGSIEANGDVDWFEFKVENSGDSFLFEFRLDDNFREIPFTLSLFNVEGDQLYSETSFTNFLYSQDARFGRGYSFAEAGDYYVVVEASASSGARDYALRALAVEDDQAPGLAGAQRIDIDEGLDGTTTRLKMDFRGDVDHFTFALEEAETFTIFGDIFAATTIKTVEGDIIFETENFLHGGFALDLEAGEYVIEMTSLFPRGANYPLDVTFQTFLLGDDYSADSATVASLSTGGAINGISEIVSDVDWIRFEADANQTVTFEIESDDAAFRVRRDLLLNLRDDSGNIVGSSIVKEDELTNTLDAVFEEAGTYFIEIKSLEAFFSSGINQTYTLTATQSVFDFSDTVEHAEPLDIGTPVTNRLSANDRDYFRLSLDADTQYFIQGGQDDFGQFGGTLYQIDSQTGTILSDSAISLQHADGFVVESSGDYIFERLGEGQDSHGYSLNFGVEDNAQGRGLDNTGVLTIGSEPIVGTIDFGNDRDIYRIDLTQSGIIEFALGPTGGVPSSWLRLLDQNGEEISRFEQGFRNLQDISYFNVESGTYFLEVSGSNRTFAQDSSHPYRVETEFYSSAITSENSGVQLNLLGESDVGFVGIQSDLRGQVVLDISGLGGAVLTLVDQNNVELDGRLITRFSDDEIVFEMPEGGEVFLRAETRFLEQNVDLSVSLSNFSGGLQSVWSGTNYVGINPNIVNERSLSQWTVEQTTDEQAILVAQSGSSGSIEGHGVVIQFLSKVGEPLGARYEFMLDRGYSQVEDIVTGRDGTTWVILSVDHTEGRLADLQLFAFDAAGQLIVNHAIEDVDRNGDFSEKYSGLVNPDGSLSIAIRSDSIINRSEVLSVIDVDIQSGVIRESRVIEGGLITSDFSFFINSDGSPWYTATLWDTDAGERSTVVGRVERSDDGGAVFNQVNSNPPIEGDPIDDMLFVLAEGFIRLSQGDIVRGSNRVGLFGYRYDVNGTLTDEWVVELPQFNFPDFDVHLSANDEILIEAESYIRILPDGTLIEGDALQNVEYIDFSASQNNSFIDWGDGTYSIFSNDDDSSIYDLIRIDEFTYNPVATTPFPRIGTDQSDNIQGTGSYDGVLGLQENDVLNLMDGRDFGDGGSGNDTLYGDPLRALDPDSFEAQIYRAYEAVFDRAPDAAGFAAFLKELQLGNLTQEQVIAEFVGSAEFAATYGALTDQAFIEQLYRNVLGREGDDAGIAAFTAALTGGRSRASVVIEFANSSEFIQATTQGSAAFGSSVALDPAEGQVFRIYEAVFDRAPDAGGFTNFVNSIQGDVLDLIAIATEFVASAEFQATYGALSNADFVELLYSNVLPGNTDQAGRDAFTAALDGGSLSRAEVVAEFSESAEFRAQTDAAARAFRDGVFSDNADRLDGGEGNDILFGGRGADTFVFDLNSGDFDAILDFQIGVDRIEFTSMDSRFDSFAEIIALGTQLGNDAVFDFGNGQGLTLNNIRLDDLAQSDFGFGSGSAAEKVDVGAAVSELPDYALAYSVLVQGDADIDTWLKYVVDLADDGTYFLADLWV